MFFIQLEILALTQQLNKKIDEYFNNKILKKATIQIRK